MAEKLPEPSIEAPVSRTDLLYSLDEQRTDWRDNKGSTSWDGQRVARIALANLNLLLDFYPNAVPRDHLVVGH